MNKKNILIFVWRIKKWWWWVDTWAIELWNQLNKEWYNISYLTVNDYWKDNYKCIWKYYSIYENQNLNQNSFSKKIYNLFYRSYTLKKICIKEKIDVVISWWWWTIPNLNAIFSKFLLNKPKIIITIHSNINFYSKLNIKLSKIFFYFADLIICISREQKKILSDLLLLDNKKIITIYNPIREITNSINNNNNNNKIDNLVKQITFVGRLSKEKNLFFLLDIFNEVFKRTNNLKLNIIWDWDLKGELFKYKKNLESCDNIFFLWTKENIYDYLKQADYSILSSVYEWFPMIAIESLSVWTPIITHDFKTWAKEIIRNNTDLENCTDIEIHENWILIPYMDKQKFINWIEKALNTNFSKEKIIYNSNKFKTNNIIKKWIEVIEK